MKIATSFQIGQVAYTLEVDEENPKEALHQAIALSNPRDTCNVCGAVGFETKHMTTNRTGEGYLYIKVECGGCGARSTLGEYRTGGYFWKEYEQWSRDAEDETPAPAQSANGVPDAQISPAGLDALNQKLKILEWSPKEVAGWLEQNFGVRRLQDLSHTQGRQAYRMIEEEVKKAVPF